MEEKLNTTVGVDVPKVDIDRVGDVGQKEMALAKAGATRKLWAEKIVLLLNATKTTEKLGSDGTMIIDIVPDLDKVAKGLDLLGKAFGDLKEFDKAGSVTNNFTFATMVKLASTVHNNVLPEKTSDVAVDDVFKNRVLDAS